MADRYELKTARKDKNGKTWWTRVGVMWPMRGRDGFSITLEALPLPALNDEGVLECRVVAWPPYEDKDKAAPSGAPATQDELAAQNAGQPDLDDEIPF